MKINLVYFYQEQQLDVMYMIIQTIKQQKYLYVVVEVMNS